MHRRLTAALRVLLTAIGVWSTAVHALEVRDVFAALARVERSNATFEETRHIAALTAPLVRQGRLQYVRPGQLEMIVDKPRQERVLIVGDSLTIQNANGTRRVSLAEMPAVAGWIESLRATLAGDVAGLERHFRVEAAGELAQWTLELTPLDQELSFVIARIRISGAQARLARIEIDERGGDRSVMQIAPADRKP